MAGRSFAGARVPAASPRGFVVAAPIALLREIIEFAHRLVLAALVSACPPRRGGHSNAGLRCAVPALYHGWNTSPVVLHGAAQYAEARSALRRCTWR
jgi:hypothetical protein